MRYRTQSTNVLNEADRLQRILDWQLFCHDQEQRLYGPSGSKWMPGDPLYPHPWSRNVAGQWYTEPDVNDPATWAGHFGNEPRHMIQIIDDNAEYIRCEPCEVTWWGKTDICWNCGEDRGINWRPKRIFSDPIGTVMDVEETQAGLYATFRLDIDAEQFASLARRMQAMFDNWTGLMREAFVIIQGSFGTQVMASFGTHMHAGVIDIPYSIEAYRAAPPPTTPFERVEREIVLVPPVIADVHAAITPTWGLDVELPADLDLSGRVEPPMPQMPEIDWAERQRQSQSGWAVFNQPPRRRRP